MRAKRVSEVFDAHAEEYDEWYAGNPEVWISELECVRSLKPRGLVLDVGVGTGAFAAAVEGEVFGVDLAARALSIARRRGVEAVQADAHELPFRDRYFDSVLMVGVLEFLEDPVAALREAVRVVKKGGFLVVCSIPSDRPWGARYAEEARRGQLKFLGLARLFSTGELLDLVERAGLEVVDHRSVLLYGPDEPRRVEKPSKSLEGSFVCLKLAPRGSARSS